MDTGKDAPAGRESQTEIPREEWGWTRRQRVGLGILLTILLAILTVQAIRRPYRIDDADQLVAGDSHFSLPQRVDPNRATAEELSRIPRIGEAMARKILQYREARIATVADGIVFHQLSDMDAIPGVGKKTLEQWGPFLQFPDEAATQP